MTRHLVLRAVALSGAMLGFCAGQPLGAQQRDSTLSDCRGFNGIYVDVWWGGTGAVGDTSRTSADSGGFRFDGRRTVDTTLTFNVAERTWTRPSVTAVVLAGASSTGASRAGTGTTAAGSGTARRGWHVCTGATITGHQPTLVLRGVRGQMHLKVDLTALAGIPGGGLSDSTRLERR